MGTFFQIFRRDFSGYFFRYLGAHDCLEKDFTMVLILL